MKRKFQKSSMLKILFSVFSMLLLLTNCQEEEIHYDEVSATSVPENTVPSLAEAQLNYETFETKNNSNTQQKQTNKSGRVFYANWEKSKIVMFNKKNKSKILYTPLLISQKNPNTKAFIGSIKNKKGRLESRIFSILYSKKHTRDSFSGILIEQDLNGNFIKAYSYEKGFKKLTFNFNYAKSKSTLAAKADDCDFTQEELLEIAQMLLEAGGGYYHQLPCVTINATISEDEYEAIKNDFNPGLLSGSPILAEGTTSGDPLYSDSPDSSGDATQWWSESTDIHDMNTNVSQALIIKLPTLTTAQENYIKDYSNYEINLLLLNYLLNNDNSIFAQNFAIEALDAIMNGLAVDFNEMTIEDHDSCPPGYVKDFNGNCVEQPCENDPIKDPEIAAQKGKSGTKGALFGCVRYGGNCNTGLDGRNKSHNGIDLKNTYGKPIFAMFDGFIYSTKYQKNGAGYYTRIQSTIDGVTFLTEYFHLQKENRILQNTQGQSLVYIKAGDIIGYQGDSGNLKEAIKNKTVESHVHIEFRLHDRSSNWGYKNFTPVDPTEYLKTTITNDGTTLLNSNCN